MSYMYDIFISYNHATKDWVHEVFLPEFKKYLGEACQEPKELKVFCDEEETAVGDSWPQKLKEALAHSKCMVSIWSPSYFKSDWCKRECAVMFYREKQLGYRTPVNPSGLVLPVNIHDGQNFPDYAKDIKFLDCRKYWRSAEAFKKTERYIEFQDKLIDWTEKVALAINNSPQWNEAWLSDEWLVKPMQHFEQPHQTNFPAPNLG